MICTFEANFVFPVSRNGELGRAREWPKTDVNADPINIHIFLALSDAQRPCSTCVRSHAYALSHAAPAQRVTMPPRPDCTYDEGDANAVVRLNTISYRLTCSGSNSSSRARTACTEDSL